MTESRDKQEPKDRILEAACKMFAEKGFKDCCVCDITNLAGTNKASINYYFGSKEKLYQKAWRQEFIRAHKKYPVDGGVSENSSPVERLRAHIRSFVYRITDPHNREFDIVRNENGNPTGLLREIMRKSIEPVRKHLEGIVREVIGVELSPQQLRLCCLSVKAQCMDIGLHKRPNSVFGKCPLDKTEVDDIVEHIFNFSFAGLMAMRETIRNNKERQK